MNEVHYWKCKVRAIIKRNKLKKNIKKLKSDYLNEEQREKKIIISLTSYRARIKSVYLTIYSLLTQSIAPDEVVLWLGEEQFPQKEKDLPEKLLALQNNGLKISWCKDVGPFTKLLPSLVTYPDTLIVTADDDIYYDKEWLEFLYATHMKYPECIVCHRGIKVEFDNKGNILPYNKWVGLDGDAEVSYSTFFTGVGGVLYPPQSFDTTVFNEDLYTMLTPTGDDIWFWAQAVKNNVKIKVAENCISEVVDTFPERMMKKKNGNTLYEINCIGKKNDKMIKDVIEYFNLESSLKR